MKQGMLLLTMSLVLYPVTTCVHGFGVELSMRDGISSGYTSMSLSSLKVVRPLS